MTLDVEEKRISSSPLFLIFQNTNIKHWFHFIKLCKIPKRSRGYVHNGRIVVLIEITKPHLLSVHISNAISMRENKSTKDYFSQQAGLCREARSPQTPK